MFDCNGNCNNCIMIRCPLNPVNKVREDKKNNNGKSK